MSPVHSISPEADVAGRHSSISSAEPRTPSPDRDEPWIMFTRHRTQSDAQYEHTEVHHDPITVQKIETERCLEYFYIFSAYSSYFQSYFSTEVDLNSSEITRNAEHITLLYHYKNIAIYFNIDDVTIQFIVNCCVHTGRRIIAHVT